MVIELVEGGVKLDLTVIKTVGLWDSLNSSNGWECIVNEIDARYNSYFAMETQIPQTRISDNRVDALLYFIKPTGHSLRQVDIEMLHHIHCKANVVLIIAKADTLVPLELAAFKLSIRSDLKISGISTYKPPSNFDIGFISMFEERAPFAIVSSTKILKTGRGRAVHGRVYPWGVVEVENKTHNDFTMLSDVILKNCMMDLKQRTTELLYEDFRTQKLLAMGIAQNNSVFHAHNLFETESKEKLKRAEEEISATLQEKVKERDAALNQAEAELAIRHAEKRAILEKRRHQLEERKKKKKN